jgi:NTP pyrophosphatase (non-canonical NTP hydrolase)
MEYEEIVEVGMLDGLAAVLHQTACEKGFWDTTPDIHFILSKIALIHSEGSEILEAVRKEKGEEEIVTEIADLVIRTLDLWAGLYDAGIVTVSLDDMMAKKMGVNAARPFRHGVLA